MKKLAVRILALCLVAVGLFVIVSLFIEGDTEWTNDAQVEQYISPINAKVPATSRRYASRSTSSYTGATHWYSLTTVTI